MRDRKNHGLRIGNNGSLSMMQTLIIILACAIVIFLFLQKFINSNKYEQAINTCQLSVMTQIATELKPGLSGAKSPLDLHCEKRYLNFYNTKVELGLSPEDMEPIKVVYDGREVKKFSKLDEAVVYHTIAEELRICKYQFGDGKVEVFANSEDFWTTQAVCFICSEIHFKQDVEPQVYESLVDYTKKNSYSNDGKTYYEYLTEKTMADNYMWEEPFKEDTSMLNIDTSKTYLVMVQKIKPGKMDLLTWNKYVSVSIMPADDINTYCQIQAN